MKTDKNIQQQIYKAFEASSLLSVSEVNVAVQNGKAILTGYANKFGKKELARKIAKEVEGVISVSEDIIIVLDDADKRSDAELRDAIAERFRKNFSSAAKDISIIVKNGFIWLEGRLKWKYQKELAEECIRDITGIKGISNTIFIPVIPEEGIDEKHVFAAIYGDPSIKSDIRLEVVGNRVILKGNVESTDQKNLVTRLVRNVAGVKEVENFLGITSKRNNS